MKAHIFRAGRVLPNFLDVDGASNQFDSLVVKGGRVLAIGNFADCRADWPQVEIHDFPNSLLIPGLQDSHCHPTIAADERCHITAPTPPDWSLQSLRKIIARSGRSNGWVKVVGITSNHIDGVPITRQLLDKACPDEPLVLTHANGHTGFVNSLGLKRLRLIIESTPNKRSINDSFLGQDPNGEPNGVIHEQLLFDITEPAISRNPEAVAIASFGERSEALQGVQAEYLSHGVTCVTECLLSLTGFDLIEALCQESFGLRFLSYLAIEQYSQLPNLQMASNSRHQVIGLKTFIDGAFNGGTCMLSSMTPGLHPLQVRGASEIIDELKIALALGAQLAVHANGDEAIDILIEAAQIADLAGRIEHGSFIRPDQMVPLREQGWGVVPFGDYIRSYGDSLIETYGEIASTSVPHSSLMRHGIPVAGSSDHPCSSLNPWSGLLSCTTRKTLSGRVVGYEEVIDLPSAMAMYTSGGAKVRNGWPGPSGELKPGSDADFTILPQVALDHDLVLRMLDESVIATYVGGTSVYP